MKKPFAFSVLIILVMLLGIGCLSILTKSRHADISGTWVIYAGGTIAPEVLQFHTDGTGIAYKLQEEYDEVWLSGKPISLDMVFDPMVYSWHITIEDKEDKMQRILSLYYSDGSLCSYNMLLEKNLDGTIFDGLVLNSRVGGGGWIRIETVGF